MKAVATVAALVGAASAAYQPPAYQPPAYQPPAYSSAHGNLSVSATSSAAPTGYEPTVTAIVSSFTTVCPTPTTLTYNSKTYTVTESTTLTISECPCTITTPVASYHEPTVTAVVTSYETYCPHPTTFTAGTSTYTVTEATTVTVTNAGDCTIVTPIGSLPPPYHKPTTTPAKPTWTYEKPSTTPKPSVYKPTWNATKPATTLYTTETVSSYTTYCPYPTTISHGTSTITVTSPTTVTFTNCPCTVTKPYTPSVAPTTYPKPETTYHTTVISSIYTTYCPVPTTIVTHGTTYPVTAPGTVSIPVVSTSTWSSVKPAPPAPTPYQPAASSPEQPAPPATTPVAPEQPPATTGQVVSQISDGQVQVPTGAASSPAQEQPAASASASVQPYTGGAGKMASSGAGVIALVAGAFFF